MFDLTGITPTPGNTLSRLYHGVGRTFFLVNRSFDHLKLVTKSKNATKGLKYIFLCSTQLPVNLRPHHGVAHVVGHVYAALL